MLRVLATSRQQLGVPGEHAWRVPSLSIPQRDSSLAPAEAAHIDSVRLFVQRASLADQNFRLTERNLGPIIEISRRLDGIPLAIELATARVKVLSPVEIQERLDDRFRFLSVSGPATIPRQRTLRALVDWSYDLLTEPEQTLFRRVSVFTGTFTLKAAEEICAESPVDSGFVLDVLYQLVDKSLVIAFSSEPTTRYGMLETIRQYAKDRLIESGELGQVQKRYRHWYTELGRRAERALEGADQTVWLESLEAELDNIRESLRSCQEADDISSCLELAAAIWRFWWIRGHLREGRAWLDASLAQRNLAPEVRAKALHAAGALAWDQTDFPAARRFLAESIKEFTAIGDLRGSALSQHKLGAVLSLQGRYEQARHLMHNSLALGRQLEDRQVIAHSVMQLGELAIFERNLSVARSLLNESLLAFRSVHDAYGITASLGMLGEIALHEGDHQTAQALLDESHRLGQAMGDKWRIARAQTMLGELARREGDIGRAASLHRGALLLRSQIGLQDGIAQSIEAIARLLNDASQSVRAAHLYGAADALRATVGLPIDLGMHADHMTQLDVVQQRLDAETFSRAWDEGRAMPFQNAVRLAMDGCDDLG